MPATTTHFNLRKPLGSEAANGPVAVGNLADDADGALYSHTSNLANPHVTTPAQIGAVATASIGIANGVAGLDSGGKVPLTQLPVPSASKTDPATSPLDVTKVFWVVRTAGTHVLPAASNQYQAQRPHVLVNLSSGNAVLNRAGSDTIQNGLTTITLGPGDSYQVDAVSATEWVIY